MNLFGGFIIAKANTLTSYLEQRPYDGAWTWLAGSPHFATVLDHQTAQQLAQGLTDAGEDVVVMSDPYGRPPQSVVEEERRLVCEANQQRRLERAAEMKRGAA